MVTLYIILFFVFLGVSRYVGLFLHSRDIDKNKKDDYHGR
jgi:hypothetical protein